MEKKGYLLLANGKLFEGVLRGAQKSATAELVSTTAMSGYMDVLTDPSYEGQIVIQTFPTIGNPGVIAPECSGSHLSGYVVRELCDTPSNFRCEGKLEGFLAEQGIPCLTGVDTRALTRCIRNNGVMNAAILTEKPADVAAAAAELAAAKITVSLPQEDVSTITTAAGEGKHHVVLWNFGAKGAIQRELEERGCTVTVVPANACAEDILRLAPDGVVLGSGAVKTKISTDSSRRSSFSTRISVASADTVLWVRGFCSFIDKNGTVQTIYTRVVSGTYAELMELE